MKITLSSQEFNDQVQLLHPESLISRDEEGRKKENKTKQNIVFSLCISDLK